jgi:hypothetical protein
MFEQDAQQSLQTPGSREDAAAIKRWLVVAMGLALGETLSSVMLAFAIANFARNWPGAAQIGVGVVWYALSTAMAVMFFRRLKRDLGRDHEPAVPLWLLKGCSPFLLAPYFLTATIFFSQRMPNPAIWIGCVFLLSAPAWYGAFAFYAAALWLRSFCTLQVELVSFTPVERNGIPSEARPFLTERQQRFEELGFDLVGDFLQKPREQQYSSMYLGAEGKFIGEATYCAAQSMQACSITTLLADGKFVESSDIDLGAPPPKSSRIFMQGKAGKTVGELLERHGEFVQRLCADADTTPVAIEPEQIELVTRYGLWLAMQELVRQRVLTENPYEALKDEVFAGIDDLLAAPVASA